jgi:hypothetical protein
MQQTQTGQSCRTRHSEHRTLQDGEPVHWSLTAPRLARYSFRSPSCGRDKYGCCSPGRIAFLRHRERSMPGPGLGVAVNVVWWCALH